MSHEIDKAISEIRSWGAIAIVGAGLSVDVGFPLIPQLTSLLWLAVDKDASVLGALAAEFGEEVAPAKELIGEDSARIRRALTLVERSRTARLAYQYGFAALDADRPGTSSPAHVALAELLHRRVVELVVSLNWDTQLEQAYRGKYGSSINGNDSWLYKPHGDASRPDLDWILPHQSGYVPDSLVLHANSLADVRPRTLLVIGYSESDEEIVDKLTGPLSNRWKVVRIGPRASGSLSVALHASEALPLILESICPHSETPGWHYVNFDTQHDLGPALAGRRLGAEDVTTCPRLAAVDSAKHYLDAVCSVLIAGESGSGKSLSAYQVAFDLHEQGWEILRLDPTVHATSAELLKAASGLPRPTLVLLDDAQARDDELQQRLLESATSQRMAVIVTTDRAQYLGNCVQIVGADAVATLAEALRQRYAEVLDVVHRLDPRVGEGFFDEALDRRLDEAARSTSAWQFSFVLTGGERRSRDDVRVLRENDRADLLLVAVATAQFATGDAGVSQEWLFQVATKLQRSALWAQHSLDLLKERRAVTGSSQLKCLHLRFAQRILVMACAEKEDAEWHNILAVLRAILSNDSCVLSGIAQLLNTLRFSSHFDFDRANTVVDETTWRTISNRCWQAVTSTERAGAALALDALADWFPGHLGAVAQHRDVLGRWLEEADSQLAWSMGWLLNNLSHDNREVTESICEEADPLILATYFNQMTWKQAPGWGWLFQRLYGAASPEWLQRLHAAIDLDMLAAKVSTLSTADLYAFNEVLGAIPQAQHTATLRIFDSAVPVLASAFDHDPVESYREISDSIWRTLGYAPSFLRYRNPTRRQQVSARRFALAIDAECLAQAISASRQRDWETYGDLMAFLKEAAPEHAKRVAQAVDLSKLDITAANLWSHPPHEFLNLMLALAVEEDRSPASGWIARHAQDLSDLNMVLAALAPYVVAELLRTGKQVATSLRDLQFAAIGLVRLAEVDGEACVQVAKASSSFFTEQIERMDQTSCEDLRQLLIVLKAHAPSVLTEIVDSVQVESAEHNWVERLQGKQNERQALAAIIDTIEPASEHMQQMIERLRQRFSRAFTVGTTRNGL